MAEILTPIQERLAVLELKTRLIRKQELIRKTGEEVKDLKSRIKQIDRRKKQCEVNAIGNRSA